MNLELDDKVAVVLAGTAGLGLATAAALCAEGARVAVCGRDEERLGAALADLRERYGDRVRGESVDVTDRERLERFLEGVRAHWGTVHALVLNAGGPPPGSASTVRDRDLDRAFELTLKSAVWAVRCALPWMRAQRYGRIVALTSITVREPIADLALSNVVRSGLTAWLKSLATEVAPDGVTVNSICTGYFDTLRLQTLFDARSAQTGRTPAEERAAVRAALPVGRLGDPAEMGALVSFLCSGRAGFLTGAALPLDGGAGHFLL